MFHVLNRAVQDLVLFESQDDYEGLLQLLATTMARIPIRLLAYVLMPNHWHLILWPLDDKSLSVFMKKLTSVHAQRWRNRRGSRGRGAVYQGRFKAIAVQHDAHLLTACRYVERNPLRARLVSRAEDWLWSSAADHTRKPGQPHLTEWPVPRPADWLEQLNLPEPPALLDEIRNAVRSDRHFGSESWRRHTAEALGWRSGLRGPGNLGHARARQAPGGLRATDDSVVAR